MTSLAKGLIVLEVLNSSSGPRTIANLSRATGLSRAAVRRCLYTLSKLDYVRSTKDGHRELWSRMTTIRNSAGLRKALARTASPLLQRSKGDEVVCICEPR
jgi:IclR family pca regulon transcriptional regulator